MKYKTIIIIFLAGVLLNILGGLLKIMHWPGASVLFFIATVLEVAAVILLIIKLLKDKNTNSFLNK